MPNTLTLNDATLGRIADEETDTAKPPKKDLRSHKQEVRFSVAWCASPRLGRPAFFRKWSLPTPMVGGSTTNCQMRQVQLAACPCHYTHDMNGKLLISCLRGRVTHGRSTRHFLVKRINLGKRGSQRASTPTQRELRRHTFFQAIPYRCPSC